MKKKESADAGRLAPASANPEKPRPQIIDVRTLLGEENEVWLQLEDEMYRMRITSKGKLILTK